MKPTIVRVPDDKPNFSFSPDGRSLLLCGYVRRFPVFDLQEGRVAFTIETTEPMEHGLSPVFSVDGRSVLVGLFWSRAGTGFGQVVVFDWESRSLRLTLAGHRKGSCGYIGVWSPDSSRIVTIAHDGTAKVWDANSGRKLKSLKAKKQGVMSTAVSPDGRFLAVGCEFGYLNYFDCHTYQELFCIRVGTQDIRDMSFSSDSRWLRIACGTGLKILDAETGAESMTLPSRCWWRHAVSQSGDLVACSHTVDSKKPWVMAVHLWDLREGRCVATLPAQEGKAALTFAFSPNEQYLAVSYDGAFAFSPDGQTIAAIHDHLQLWSIDDLRKRGVDRSQFGGKDSDVIRSTDARTGSERAAEQAVKKPKRASGVKGMPFPNHLVGSLQRLQSRCSATHCFGRFRCPCGEKAVLLSTTDAFYESNGVRGPATLSWNGDFYFVIHAECPMCGIRHVLFDSKRHGWNAVCVADMASDSPSPPMTAWNCASCGKRRHEISVGIVGEPMRVAIEESGDLLDESNWQEGFGAINMSIKCTECGHENPGWVNYETM